MSACPDNNHKADSVCRLLSGAPAERKTQSEERWVCFTIWTKNSYNTQRFNANLEGIGGGKRWVEGCGRKGRVAGRGGGGRGTSEKKEDDGKLRQERGWF